MTTAAPTIVTLRGPRARIADADTWLSRACWTVVALACTQVLLFGFGRDQGIYATVADAVIHGGMPYRDAWDFKPPGIFLVYALADVLFGRTMASVRILEVAGIVAMVFAFRRMAREMFGAPAAGLVGGAMAALVHAELEFWHTGQPESFGGMLTVFALAITTGPGVTSERRTSRLFAWTAVGALFGAAFLLKPPLGGGAVVTGAYLARGEYLRTRRFGSAFAPVLVAGVASLVPIGACALWFHARGAWPALSWTLFDFTPGYTALGWHGSPTGLYLYALEECVMGFSYLIPAGVAAALVLRPIHGREREAVFLVFGIVSMHAAGIALQAKFFQYHYGATHPLLAFVGGLGLYKVFRRLLRYRVLGLGALAAVVVGLVLQRVAVWDTPGTFWERSLKRLAFALFRQQSREELDRTLYYVADYDLDVDKRAARAVRALTAASDSVFVWGFEPAVYWFSERRWASRYVYDVPQRASWGRERARSELMSDLATDPPRVVVVQHGDFFSFVTGDSLDSYGALATFPELDELLRTGYHAIERVDDLDIYVRN
jgi:hypothetical protein